MPIRPKGEPAGKCGDSDPSLASGSITCGLLDAVNALVGNNGPGQLLVVREGHS